MVLPPGATKGSGLERLLTLCGLSPRNLAAVGGAENDLSMLTLAEVSVAVGDAGLASRLRKMANRHYEGEELREALGQVVSTHYEEIRRSR